MTVKARTKLFLELFWLEKPVSEKSFQSSITVNEAYDFARINRGYGMSNTRNKARIVCTDAKPYP
jgi:hypothetical protein